jgi:PEP-CTERM motif
MDVMTRKSAPHAGDLAVPARFVGLLAASVVVLFASHVQADTITLNSTKVVATSFSFTGGSSDWLLVGTAPGSVGTTVSVNSGFELGAHLPLDGLVPTDGSPDIGDVSKPTGALDPTIGIGMNGDTALTSTSGTFNFESIDGDGWLDSNGNGVQDPGETGRSGVYGDTGVQCSQATGPCTSGDNDDTYYNSTGTFPMPDTLLSSSNGIQAGDETTLEDLRDYLAMMALYIPTLDSSGTLTGGTFGEDLYIDLTASGLYVLDVADDGDWDLGNYDIIIDGLASSFLIIRIPDGVNMKTSNSWIGVGDGGIGLTNVLFYTAQDSNSGHFNFNNTVFNGVSFWDLSGTGADLAVSNGQGCAQFIADQIVMNNVRLNNCGFSGETFDEPPDDVPVPEPSSLVLLGTGLAAAVGRWRRRRHRAR